MNCILVRHAHADWPDYQGPDFERPLTERGFREARATARQIAAAGYSPALLLASAARRTRQTAEILAQAFGLAGESVRLLDNLYNAPASTLAVELRKAAAGNAPILLVAHNPGVSILARELTGDMNAPPCRPAEWRVAMIPAGDSR